MAIKEHDEQPQATPREFELQTRLDVLQLTELKKAQVTVRENPELLSEVQSLKEKLGEHTNQLGKSAEKLSQLEDENLVL